MIVRAASFLLIAATAGTAVAAPLPLRHGTYVRAGTSCGDPAFAGMREWDGIGMADPHSHACHARVVARRGAGFVVDNSCIGTGVGPGRRTTERLVIAPTRGGMTVNGVAYAYCPAASLPPSLRTRAER